MISPTRECQYDVLCAKVDMWLIPDFHKYYYKLKVLNNDVNEFLNLIWVGFVLTYVRGVGEGEKESNIVSFFKVFL